MKRFEITTHCVANTDTLRGEIKQRSYSKYTIENIYAMLKSIATHGFNDPQSSKYFYGLFLETNLAAHLLQWDFGENYPIKKLGKEELSDKIRDYLNEIIHYVQAVDTSYGADWVPNSIAAARTLILNAIVDEINLPAKWQSLSSAERSEWLILLSNMPYFYWDELKSNEIEKLQALMTAQFDFYAQDGMKIDTFEKLQKAVSISNMVIAINGFGNRLPQKPEGFTELKTSIVELITSLNPFETVNQFSLEEQIKILEAVTPFIFPNYSYRHSLDQQSSLKTWIDQSFDRIQKEIGKVGIDAIGKNNIVQYLNLLASFYKIFGNWKDRNRILKYLENFSL